MVTPAFDESGEDHSREQFLFVCNCGTVAGIRTSRHTDFLGLQDYVPRKPITFLTFPAQWAPIFPILVRASTLLRLRGADHPRWAGQRLPAGQCASTGKDPGQDRPCRCPQPPSNHPTVAANESRSFHRPSRVIVWRRLSPLGVGGGCFSGTR